jgi:hypothetical protein
MAAKPRLDQLKHQIEQLRKDSLGIVASANRIVYDGVQKLADRELKALNDYYHSAIDSIRSANKGDLRGLAQQQLDLLQDTVNQVIGHARESMGIVAETRAELAKLVQQGVKGEKVGAAELKKAAAPARKAVGKVQAAAKKAGKDAGKSVKKATSKARSSTSKAVAEGKRGAAVVSKAVERVLSNPSPSSRASLATSRAKKAAGVAAEKVSGVVSSVADAVAEAATKVSDAAKKQG